MTDPQVRKFLGLCEFLAIRRGIRTGSRIAINDDVRESQVLAWRPKTVAPSPSPATRPPEYVWTMVKKEWRIDCLVEEGGRLPWAIRVLVNHRWFFRCEFPTWVAAIDAAEIKYAELFRAGWTPAPISTFDHPTPSSRPALLEIP
jgi:hypothetical protein